MNKNDLIHIVSKECEISPKKAREIINAYNDTIVNACAAGEKVKIAKFGTFEGRPRKERNGVNPKNTEEKIVIPKCIMPYLKPSKTFRNKLNQ